MSSDIEWQGYVVFDVRSNEVVAITGDSGDAARRAAEHALEIGEEDFAWDAAFEGAMRPAVAIAANPPILRGHAAPPRLSTAKIAEDAFRRTLLPETERDVVMAISLADAWEKVASLFPKVRQFKGGREQKIAYLDSPKKGAENLIRDNYKLEKDHRGRGRPAWVKGLSLVPVGAVFDGVSGNRSVVMPYEGLLQGGLGDAEERWDERRSEGWHPTLCHGASVECRATCLVFSGSNVKQAYNTEVKQAAAAALIRYPNEFLRVLHESIRVFREKALSAKQQPYVRLNVYSDVPWERVAPWLFTEFKGEPYEKGGVAHGFYDYSKLPGRKTPENYDLTFSFSGSNWPFVVSELRRGRRAAVVFFMPDSPEMRRIGKGGLTDEQYAKVKAAIRRPYYAGQKWYGLPVVDGDLDDVRPRDPGQCWVGLTWKPTKGSAGVRPRTFVLYCYLIDGRLAVAHTPRATKLSEEEAELSGVAILKAKAFRDKERPVKRAFRVPVEEQRRLPLARNADEDLRKLQRAALSGDAEASARLARGRARAGMSNVRLTLQRLAETDEWRVNYWINNKRDDEKSYYTNDKADAVATMALMQKEIDAGPTTKNPGGDERLRSLGRGGDAESWWLAQAERRRRGLGPEVVEAQIQDGAAASVGGGRIFSGKVFLVLPDHGYAWIPKGERAGRATNRGGGGWRSWSPTGLVRYHREESATATATRWWEIGIEANTEGVTPGDMRLLQFFKWPDETARANPDEGLVRNADEGLRALQRAFRATGSPQDAARLLNERVRTDTLAAADLPALNEALAAPMAALSRAWFTQGFSPYSNEESIDWSNDPGERNARSSRVSFNNGPVRYFGLALRRETLPVHPNFYGTGIQSVLGLMTPTDRGVRFSGELRLDQDGEPEFVAAAYLFGYTHPRSSRVRERHRWGDSAFGLGHQNLDFHVEDRLYSRRQGAYRFHSTETRGPVEPVLPVEYGPQAELVELRLEITHPIGPASKSVKGYPRLFEPWVHEEIVSVDASSNPRRNPDETQRDRARRAASSGDVEDRARVLKDRLRTGKASADNLSVAAWLGDRAAAMVVPAWNPGPGASLDLEAQGMFQDWRSSVYIALRWGPIALSVLRAFSVRMAEHVLPLLGGDKDAESVVWRLKNGEGSAQLSEEASRIMSFYYGESDSSHRAVGDVLREAAFLAERPDSLDAEHELSRWAADTSFSGARAFAPSFEAGDAWWTTVPAEEKEFQRSLLIGLLTGDES